MPLDETFQSSQKIVADHLIDAVYPNLSIGYSPSNLLSPHLAALEVAVPDITMSVSSGDSPPAESLTAEMLGLQSQVCQQDAEVNDLERSLG